MLTDPYQDYVSFKEIDQRFKKDKGTAFKLFKQYLPDLVEGVDFIVLDLARQAVLIDTLRQQGRIYRSTVNLVLISLGGHKKLMMFAKKNSVES